MKCALHARIFREAGFYVVQSEYYTDLESNTSREIDVFASKERSDKGLYISIQFYVECKVSISKPWLIFTAPPSNKPIPSLELHQYEVVPPRGRAVILTLRDDEALQSLEMFMPEHLGYGAKETFIEEDDSAKHKQKVDHAYEALMQVTQCISAKAREWESYNIPIACVFMIPLIILDGTLFECYLDNTNEVVVSEIKASTVLWPMKKTQGIFSTPVTILTTDSLPGFVQKANEAAMTLFSHEPLIQKMRQTSSNKNL